MIYMLVYIPLICPVTWLLEKKGLRVIGLIATFLNALGAWIKCAAISPDRFAVLMTGQTVSATAQVFILGEYVFIILFHACISSSQVKKMTMVDHDHRCI